MTSIQIKTINGSGPYAYEVDYIEQDEQDWRYLGPVGQVSDQLTNEQRNELREERSIGQFQVAAEPDLQKRAIANEVRDELVERFGEYVLSPDDDRRTTAIKLSGDAPTGAIKVAEGQAEDMQAATKTIGQEPLTAAEKEKADFSKRSVFWYRSAKADIKNEGVSNWIDYVDPQREDPHSHSDDLTRSDRSGGKRIDENQRGTDTTSQLESMDRNEKRAVEAVAADDDPDARAYLREEAGYEPGEIDAAANEVVA
jgi:RNase P/RNase MRP subunit POP5